MQPDPTGAEADHGTDLEQLKTDGVHLRLGPLGALQRKPPQRLDQRIAERREVEAQLFGLHFFRRQPVGSVGGGQANQAPLALLRERPVASFFFATSLYGLFIRSM